MKLDVSEAARALLTRERKAILDLQNVLVRLDANGEDLKELRAALDDLEGIFMLVVAGEYNAGKSSLVNAILGEKVMPEGVTPTTDRITIVTYGPSPKEVEESVEITRREYPAEILRDLAFVDTPGTNAVIQRHQELTERFVPRADLVLFVTSADRPFTESERRFLELIGSWGKKIVLVVNKLDILEGEAEREKVLEYVREQARATLGSTPQVFGVAAKRAFAARQRGDEAALQASGLRELERFIERTLAASERLRLKLLNPLGVSLHLAEKYQGVVTERLALLEDDRRTLEEVDRQLAQYDKEMHREFEGYLNRIKTVLLEVERRGEVFFDEVVRLGNVLNLLNGERVRQDFEARVIRGADREIDLAVAEMVDWFIQRNLNLWEDVMRFVNERRKAGEDARLIGEVGGRFQYDREQLIRSLRQSAEEVLSSYDDDREGRRLAESLQGAVLQSGLLGVSGLGLGAAIVALLSGAALDITGIALGLTIAGVGLLILPRRRQQAKLELHQEMQRLRDGLQDSLGKQFEAELRRAREKLHTAIAPYTRFVRSELERLDAIQQELEKTRATLVALRREVEALADPSTPTIAAEEQQKT